MVDFVASQGNTYSEKRKKSILLIMVVVGVMLVFSLLMGHNVVLASSILFLLFLIQLYKSSLHDRFFIKHLIIKNDDVHITYEDKGVEIVLAGKLGEVTIKKEKGLRTIYLAVYQDKKLQIQQFVHGDWTETKFDEVEQYIRKYGVLGKELG